MWSDDLEPLADITAEVFLDVAIETPAEEATGDGASDDGNGAGGRIVLGLYGDVAPKTAENFRALCTGETGTSYEGTIFHRVFWDFMVQGGDVENRGGSGGRSIYGPTFPDEGPGLELYHDRPGLLGMANRGPDTNSSQFYITTAPASWLDGQHVVFGEVLQGRDTVLAIERLASQSGDPLRRASVVACGALR